jgi:hypothetical protein
MFSLIPPVLEQSTCLLATVKHGIFMAVKNSRTLRNNDDRSPPKGC